MFIRNPQKGERLMGRKSNYEKGMFDQLQEIMGRLESVEKEHTQDIRHLNDEISDLKKENELLHAENQLLREEHHQ